MQVRDQVLDRILDGRLCPGQVNESQLAASLNVSRTPVREALLTLAPMVGRRGRGFELSELSAREAKEVYPLVGALECLALDFIDLPLSPDSIDRLTAANARIRQAAEPKAALESDVEWHRTLLSLSRNRTVRALVDAYRAIIARYEIAYFSAGGAFAIASDDHDEILECLRNGNREGAQAALRLNWLRGVDAIAETIDWL